MKFLLRRSEARELMGITEYRLKKLIRTGQLYRIYLKENSYGYYSRKQCLKLRKDVGDGK